jgi:hypothetical protein
VTLISAFRVASGVAICADSQETCTYYEADGNPYEVRRAVQKISPVHVGACQVAIAGSGNAPLIESFIVRARRRLQTDNLPAPSVEDVLRTLEDELALFYRNDVAICPDPDKSIRLFVAASCPKSRGFNVWVSENAVLREIASDRPELVGWAHELYDETAKRLYAPQMSMAQAILASIYTLTVAKQTSNYVGGGLSVAVVRENGIWMENPRDVAEMEARLRSYEAAVNALFLLCSDTEVSPKSLDAVIELFKKRVTELHNQHLDAMARSLYKAGPHAHDSLLSRVPPNTVFTVRDGQLSNIEYDVDIAQRINDAIQSAQPAPENEDEK